ncbi:calcium-binding protein [Sulfitobacter sp. SK012]|uniref:calcium-binding protein n=1 Tax=Sulfitobacter sp. SK012 TaxID=1389005 RepID=UPI0013B476FF|nr:calcium-binding protein [Sulfitobacter sp. SK012]
MQLYYQYHLTSNVEALDTDIRDLEIVRLSTGTYLYSATGQGGGVSMYRLRADGNQALLRDTSHYSGPQNGTAIGQLTEVELNGMRQLLVGGLDGAALAGNRLLDNGELGGRIITTLPGSTAEPTALAVLLGNGTEALYAVDEAGGLLTTYTVRNDGSLGQRSVASSDRDAFTLDVEVQLEIATIGNRSFVLAADSGGDGVSSFMVTNVATGALGATDRLGAEQGLGIDTPTVLQTVQAYGATWVLVGSAGSGSISVMRLFYDGRLEATDHILDSRDTRFDDLAAMDVVRVGDQALVVAGGGDDGLSLLSLLPDGQLVHLQSIAHDGENGLDNISSIEVIKLNGRLQVFVSATNTPGVMQFSIDVSNIGIVMRDTGVATDRLTGGAGDDMIVGGLGVDILNGGAGDDIMVSGYGRGVMDGGSGRDIFVIRPGEGMIRIRDFNPSEDRLDLGHLPMLRNTGQLNINQTGYGARITYGDTVIDIDSHNGQSLGTRDFFPGSMQRLGTPDRAMILSGPYDPSLVVNNAGAGTPDYGPRTQYAGGIGDVRGGPTYGGDGPGSNVGTSVSTSSSGTTGGTGLPGARGAATPGRTVNATERAQVISGSVGDDTISVGGGNDRVFSGAGHDFVAAGLGNDMVGSGSGWDTVNGGWGNDSIYGGSGNDLIRGQGGHDELWGGNQNDIVEGGAGNDLLGGGRGDDIVRGGDGNDTVYAFWGADRIGGGNGNDEIWGGYGTDTIWGDGGSDTIGLYDGNDAASGGWGSDLIYGGRGNDRLEGNGGHDELYGAPGADTINGGSGSDTIYGGSENDWVNGGEGADLIYGGRGRDTIVGGNGNDRLGGGADADSFVFHARHGTDRVADFRVNQDQLHFDIENLSLEDVRITQVGNNAVVNTIQGTITLEGVRASSLDSDDFLFG